MNPTPPPHKPLPRLFYTAIAHARWHDFPVFLFLLGIVTRLSGYLTSAIWYDEAISLFRARLPLPNLLTDVSEIQGINLWELILRPFALGPLWLLRLPALLCSIASIWIAWLIMVKLKFSKTQITISMIALATLPGLLWMSQDARYYSGLAFFYLLAIWAGLERRRWTMLLSCAALVGIHPTGPLWAVSALVIAVLDGFPIRPLWPLVMVIPIFVYKAIAVITNPLTSVFWLQDYSGAYMTIQTLLAIFADTLDGWPAILGLTVVSAMLTIAALRLKSKTDLTIYLSSILPLAGIVVISLAYTPIYFYRTIQPVLPMFCILAGVTLAPGRRWYTWLVPVMAIVVIVMAMGHWDPTSRGARVDDAATFIASNWQDGDILYYGTGTVGMPFDYYLHGRPSYILDASHPNLNLAWPGIPFRSAPLEDIIYTGRAWVIYPLEPLIDPSDRARLDSYVQNGTLIWRTDIFHFAPITIWLVEK